MNNEIRMKANNIRVSVAEIIRQLKNSFSSLILDLLLNNELIKVSFKARVQRINVQTLLIALNCLYKVIYFALCHLFKIN